MLTLQFVPFKGDIDNFQYKRTDVYIYGMHYAGLGYRLRVTHRTSRSATVDCNLSDSRSGWERYGVFKLENIYSEILNNYHDKSVW